jgi:hypothetical protein
MVGCSYAFGDGQFRNHDSFRTVRRQIWGGKSVWAFNRSTQVKRTGDTITVPIDNVSDLD